MTAERGPERQPAAPAQIIRAYLAISALFTLSASVIWGVYTLFLLDAGLDIFGVFIVNAAFTAGMVVFEIPTGVVADTFGRRRSFLLSAVALLVGTVGYIAVWAVGGGLGPFLAASAVLGLGYAFYSGSVEAWLVDALRATGYHEQLDRVFARGSFVSGAAMLVGSVGGGLLGSVNLAWPFVLRCVLLVVAFVVAGRVMHDIGFTPRATTLAALPSEMKKVFRAGLTFGWRTRAVRLLMLVSLVQGGFLIWGFYAWQPYFLELLGRDAAWVTGLVSAFIALSTMAGNGLVEYLANFCGRRTTLLLAASTVMGLAAAGVGIVGSFWPAVVLLLVAIAAMGVSAPVQQAYIHEVVPSSERATVVSSVSLMGSAGGVGGSLGLGYLSRAQSVATGYVVGGLATLLSLPPLLLLRRMLQPTDAIIGRRAGKRGHCAGQGLPDVAAVDTTPRQPEPVG